MWRFFAVFFCFATSLAELSPNYFCADMFPQTTIHISQLMGMWYGVEKIDHLDERHFIRKEPSCPVIHISEDHPLTTLNPLYGNRLSYGYGQGQGYATGVPYPKTPEQIYEQVRQRAEYDRKTTYRNHPSRRLNQDYLNQLAEEHFLRLYWDEKGESTEYHLRYNVSKPGFWISSGPENEATLKKDFSHFAGTIQVLKAVGNHMVLTVCHQVPERQVYSVLLSREAKLEPVEIHIVHRMLNRKGLNTNAVHKLCNNGSSRLVKSNFLSLILIARLIYEILK